LTIFKLGVAINNDSESLADGVHVLLFIIFIYRNERKEKKWIGSERASSMAISAYKTNKIQIPCIMHTHALLGHPLASFSSLLD
jgi:hypothetical protein